MSNTVKLFENMQLNLKESNSEFEWLDQENMEKYMTADSILGRCDLYFGDTAEELGVDEEEAIQNQADIYKVEIVEKNLLGPEYGGSAGCWDITAKGAPKDIIQFFSNGEFNNGNDYIRAFDLEVKLPEIKEEIENSSNKFYLNIYQGAEVGYVGKEEDNYIIVNNKEDAISFSTKEEAENAAKDVEQFFNHKAKVVATN